MAETAVQLFSNDIGRPDLLDALLPELAGFCLRRIGAKSEELRVVPLHNHKVLEESAAFV